jgi:hypothetical protein
MTYTLADEAMLGLNEDDAADLARGRMALNHCWKRLRNLCYRQLNNDDIDAFSEWFRELNAAIVVIDKYLQMERDSVPR